jgi:hypothetical protein
MDQGGREQVKFILKENLIHIVDNHGLPNNNIEGEVDASELAGYKLEYSINGKEYKPLKNKLVINKEELTKPSIDITVRGIKDKEVVYYKSDTIPLTHTIIFGGTLEERYPEVIKLLLQRMAKVEQFVGLEMKHTKDTLHEHMLELVDTFEEINKKGSLF